MREYVLSIIKDHNGDPSSSRWLAFLAFFAMLIVIWMGLGEDPKQHTYALKCVEALGWIAIGCVSMGQARSGAAEFAQAKGPQATTPALPVGAVPMPPSSDPLQTPPPTTPPGGVS